MKNFCYANALAALVVAAGSVSFAKAQSAARGATARGLLRA